MRRLNPLILLAALAFAFVMWQRHAQSPGEIVTTGTTAATRHAVPDRQPSGNGANADLPAFLPTQAKATVEAISRGGPFEHHQDGVVFGNYEGQLPQQPRGYYHEYTVETPGAATRGARRIITGGTPPVVWYYTDDHYLTFRRFEMPR